MSTTNSTSDDELVAGLTDDQLADLRRAVYNEQNARVWLARFQGPSGARYLREAIVCRDFHIHEGDVSELSMGRYIALRRWEGRR